MRRIIVQHVAIDKDGHDWEMEVTVPWVDHANDTVKYGPGKTHGPDTPQVIINTPNNPEHPLYGEDGPTFDLATLESLCVKARRAEERERTERAKR